MAILSYTDLRNGVVFKQDKDIYVVLKYEHIKKGRGSAIVKVKVKNLKTGAIVIKSFKAGDKLESADVSKESAQFLYTDDENGYFMDMKTFDQYSIPIELISDQVPYLKEGQRVVVQRLEEQPISVEIPKKIELKIIYTEPGVAGDTTSGAMKLATLETGIKINVPLFIKIGDVVIINTENGKYVSRK